MNILFLTLVEINSLDEKGIYQDLLRKFATEGHTVTIVTPVERRRKISTRLIQRSNTSILQVKTFNIQKTNMIEKGIGTLAIEHQYLSAVKKYLRAIKFDVVLYSTPPITFAKIISYVKQRDGAISYLLLKDIFPQNAVDMKMMKEGGFLHKFFLKKEKNLYKVSDFIGCMSQANVNFLLKHNPEIPISKIEVNPNTIEPTTIQFSEMEKRNIRRKYGLPQNKKILVYGGNLGKPQGLEALLETISTNKIEKAFFLIVGNGTEFNRLNEWFKKKKPTNALLLKGLPKHEYDLLLSSCDIGLIFLHKDFLIPNFPSRLLSYLEMKIPVISVTDSNTDIGEILEKNHCGKKVLAENINQVNDVVDFMVNKADLKQMGANAWNLLQKDYLVDRSYNLIISKVKEVPSNVSLG